MRELSKAETAFRIDFLKYSTRYRKKHGDWAIFKFDNEGTFLSMDTWNGALYYRKGSGDYSYWNGFDGEIIYYFQCNESWSRNDPRQPENVIKYFHNKMMKELLK